MYRLEQFSSKKNYNTDNESDQRTAHTHKNCITYRLDYIKKQKKTKIKTAIKGLGPKGDPS